MTEQTAKETLAEGVPDALAGVASRGVSTETVAPSVKSVLPPGAFMTSDHRYYFNGEGPQPSVTTVLEVLSKPALVTWKAKESVRAYIRNRAEVDRILMETPDGEERAIKRAMELVDATRDKAASLGTSVHLLADMVTRSAEATGSLTTGFQVSDEERPYIGAWVAFMAFLEAQGASIVSSEKIVWSRNGYAGTYDLLIQWDGELWLIDIKTSKGYYPEYGLQLAAYRWADSIILPGDPREYSMPEVHRSGVLHLRPDQYKEGWALIEYPTTYEKDYMTFLGALEIWKWRKEGRFTKTNLNRS